MCCYVAILLLMRTLCSDEKRSETGKLAKRGKSHLRIPETDGYDDMDGVAKSHGPSIRFSTNQNSSKKQPTRRIFRKIYYIYYLYVYT